MLEIVLLVVLTRKIGAILQGKGRTSGWFKFLTVVLWFGGEIVGGVIGVVVGEMYGFDIMVAAYPLALLGAIAGAIAAYVIAQSARPAEAAVEPPPPPPVFT